MTRKSNSPPTRGGDRQHLGLLAAGLAGDQHLGRRGGLGERQLAVHLLDEVAAQRDQEQDPEDAAEQRDQEQLEEVDREAEDEQARAR